MEPAPIEDHAPSSTMDTPLPEESLPRPSLAPPSTTSALSDAPTTDALDPADTQANAAAEATSGLSSLDTPLVSTDPAAVPPQAGNDDNVAATATTLTWDATGDQVMQDMATPGRTTTQATPRGSAAPKRGARGGKRGGLVDGDPTPKNTPGENSTLTPGSSGRGRGRGRGGRPRGKARGGGRGGKRKRGEDEGGEESDDSEVYTPAATMTKSGRSIQKPTSFVPPPPSPTSTNVKRKRTYRRNPESAVCKMCLRGTSPATNMIVFCDGCNTPYHRYCHQPPINQAVIDEVDKEWYCKPCEKERIVPVPEHEVSSFVSAEGAPIEQRQKYFASLSPGLLVTLLTRATTLKPDLPVFGPDFEARPSTSADAQPSNGQSHPTPTAGRPLQTFPQTTPVGSTTYVEDARYPVPEEHPPHFVRPGQGLMNNLPAERDDLQWLVDKEDRNGVFNHYVLNPQSVTSGSGGGMGQARPGA